MRCSRTFFLLLVGGCLLGIVFYCWQVSLAAFNDITGLKEPARLWSLQKTGADRIELEFLGKKLVFGT